MHIEISQLHPKLDGDYPLEWDFTKRELHYIKRTSGVRPVELLDALINADAALVVAMTSVALTRAGVVFDEDVLWDDHGSITFVDDEEDEETLPPAETPLSSEPGGGEKNSTSGPSSEGTSGNPGSGPSRTGSPVSDIGSDSNPKT